LQKAPKMTFPHFSEDTPFTDEVAHCITVSPAKFSNDIVYKNIKSFCFN